MPWPKFPLLIVGHAPSPKKLKEMKDRESPPDVARSVLNLSEGNQRRIAKGGRTKLTMEGRVLVPKGRFRTKNTTGHESEVFGHRR